MPEHSRIKMSASAGRERVLAAAVDLARGALIDLTRAANVGEHVDGDVGAYPALKPADDR